MYRRCFTHQSSPPHQDGPRRGWPSSDPQRSPGDERWRLLMPPVSIVERRRTRCMAIAADDDNFYNDIFGGSDGRWWARGENSGDDHNKGRHLEGKHRSRSSDRSSSEDRNRCARSLRSLVALEEDGEPSGLPTKLRSALSDASLRHGSPATAARLAPRREEASLSRTSSWLQDLQGCGGDTALWHAFAWEKSSCLCLSEAISVSTSSMCSVRKVPDGETSTEFNISPLSPASAECERAVDRRLMSLEERNALEELERAVVLDVDDVVDGDCGDGDEGAVDVRGGSWHRCWETEMSAAVDEAIAWARERFLSGHSRKEEELMESEAAAGRGGRDVRSRVEDEIKEMELIDNKQLFNYI